MSHPVVTFLYPKELPPETDAVINEAVPDAHVLIVPYQEPNELRNARRQGSVTPELLALAPVLSDDDWAILERTTVLVALDVPDGLLERATNLALIQAVGAGTDHFDLDAIARFNVHLSNGSGFNATAIAEFIMARILQIWKNLRRIDQQQREQVWIDALGRSLVGTRLGIVGLGAIGRATAQIARAFGMYVVASRRSAKPGDRDSDVDELFPSNALDEMIADCDIVVIAAALTPETRHLFDGPRIARMKPGSVLCNVARGGLIEEPSLIAALERGHLAAAVLDVAQLEPLPPGDPLWTAPNCYLSPHSATSAAPSRLPLVERTARNLSRILAGEPPEARVI